VNVGIRVVLADGSIVESFVLGDIVENDQQLQAGVKSIGQGKLRYWLRNFGAPQFAGNTPQPGRIVEFRSVYIGVPNDILGTDRWRIQYAHERGIGQPIFSWDGMDIYRVCDEMTYHSRPHGPTTPHHVLMGGEQLWIDVDELGVTEGDVPDTQAIMPAAAKILAWDDRYPRDRFPDLEQLRSLYTASAKSGDLKSTDRDLGWWLNWAAERHSLNADGTTRIPNTRNLWDFGSVIWADGHSNGNYDPILHAVEHYLRTHDPFAWHVAYLMARHKVAHGLISCEDEKEPQWGKWRYEKSAQAFGYRGRPGDQNLPVDSHQWDAGVLLVAHLSQDPDLLDAVAIRGERILKTSPTLTHYGPRAFAWNLANLYAFYCVTKDQRYKAHAQAEIARAQTLLAGPLARWGYWPDDPTTGEWSPWQNAVALIQVAIWASEGVPVQSDLLRATARLVLDRGTRFVYGGDGQLYLQSAMILNRPPWQGTPQPDIWQGPPLTANVLPLAWWMKQAEPERYAGHWEAAHRTVGHPFRSFPDIGMTVPHAERQFDWSGGGFGAPKINSDILLFARPRYLLP
jgi:hypothetical protein